MESSLDASMLLSLSQGQGLGENSHFHKLNEKDQAVHEKAMTVVRAEMALRGKTKNIPWDRVFQLLEEGATILFKKRQQEQELEREIAQAAAAKPDTVQNYMHSAGGPIYSGNTGSVFTTNNNSNTNSNQHPQQPPPHQHPTTLVMGQEARNAAS